MTAMAASLIGPAAVLAPSASCVAPATTAGWSCAFNPGLLESPYVPDYTARRGPLLSEHEILILMKDEFWRIAQTPRCSSDGLYVNPWFGPMRRLKQDIR